MKTSFGDMDIDIPRDRNGDFEPKALFQNIKQLLSEILTEKIISMTRNDRK